MREFCDIEVADEASLLRQNAQIPLGFKALQRTPDRGAADTILSRQCRLGNPRSRIKFEIEDAFTQLVVYVFCTEFGFRHKHLWSGFFCLVLIVG